MRWGRIDAFTRDTMTTYLRNSFKDEILSARAATIDECERKCVDSIELPYLDPVRDTPKNYARGLNEGRHVIKEDIKYAFTRMRGVKKQGMKTFTEKDIGSWVTYKDGTGQTEEGKLKSFDNTKQLAWVVYKSNENWDGDHWKDYTAACTNYSDLT